MANDERNEAKNTSITNYPEVEELRRQLRLLKSNNYMAVDATIAAVEGALKGAMSGVVIGTVFSAASTLLSPLVPPGSFDPQFVTYFSQAFGGGPLVCARNYAASFGVTYGVSHLIRKKRGGKEDDITRMVEAFSGGAMLSLVTGIGFDGLNKPANVLTVGLGYSVIHTAVCKALQVVVDKSIKHNQQEELFSYATTKNMLASIGLSHLEDNFKTASLSDITLPLLTDSALKEAKIPAGARLLILDKIKRDPELRKAQG